jgi:ankyrin repeat protein
MKISFKTLCFTLALLCPVTKTIHAKQDANSTRAICRAVISTPANYSQLQSFANDGFNLNCNCLVRQRTQFLSMKETIVNFYDPIISEKTLQNRFNNNSLIETNYVTPLYIALSRKDFGLLRLLINNNIDLNQVFPNGLRPLEYALQEHKPSLFSFLIQQGANPKLVHIGCPFNISLTKKIIRLGASPMTINLTCLSHGTKEFDEVLALIPNLTEKILNQFEANALFQKPKMLEILINKGLNINQAFTTGLKESKVQKNLLIHAIEMENTIVFDLLIKKGISLNMISSNGFTPIYYAIKSNNTYYIETLVNNGANLNSINPLNEQTPLGLSVDLKFNKTSLFLLKNGSIPYSDKLSKPKLPLTKAIQQRNKALIDLIINHTNQSNLNINQYFEEDDLLKNPKKLNFLLLIGLRNSNAFLQKAIKNNRVEIVSILLHHNPNWRIANNDELPIIYQAFQHNNTLIAAQLIQKGADINTEVKGQEPVLIQAIEQNSYILVYQLLQVGANPNTLSNSGVSALQVAIQKQNIEIIKSLIERKVGITCKDYLLAIQYQNTYILKLLYQEVGSFNCKIDGKSLKYHARKLKPNVGIKLYLNRN